jgi:GT2 family glycosyltransferase
MNKVLCSVATRGRYFTTLPLVLNAVINQTKPVDKLVIFDDNDEPQDMRKELIYSYFFQMLDIKGIAWEWKYAGKKGQHHIHQEANYMGYDWVWRCDDDAIPEPNVLEELHSWIDKWPNLGAVGSHIWTPPHIPNTANVTGRIDNIDSEPNIQWGKFNIAQEVDHLHCSFLYRAGVADYNLGLSRVAHREETLFTYQLQQKGYSILVVPNAVTWHMKNPQGGIRSETRKEMYDHDEQIFKNVLAYRDKTIVVLNCGLGDHIVFNHVLPAIPHAEVFTCYPEVVPGRSIAEATQLFGDLDRWNIYKKMDQWKWKGSLENAYRKLYL